MADDVERRLPDDLLGRKDRWANGEHDLDEKVGVGLGAKPRDLVVTLSSQLEFTLRATSDCSEGLIFCRTTRWLSAAQRW